MTDEEYLELVLVERNGYPQTPKAPSERKPGTRAEFVLIREVKRLRDENLRLIGRRFIEFYKRHMSEDEIKALEVERDRLRAELDVVRAQFTNPPSAHADTEKK